MDESATVGRNTDNSSLQLPADVKPSLVIHHTYRLRHWLSSLLFIIILSVTGRDVQLYIVEYLDPLWIAGAIFTLLFFILFYILWKKSDDRSLWVVGGVLCLLITAVAAVWSGYMLPVEAVHFLVFSWLGWISSAVFGPLHGAAAVLFIAVGDEILQHFLPNRVGDVHDVVVNAISGFAGWILRVKWIRK